MSRTCALYLAVVAIGGSALIAPARAAPPTVVPSPGYDARLQESRSGSTTFYPPADPAPKPVVRHHAKRTHRGAH